MLITIVTVVLNGEKYLEHTISSVLNQDYPHIEYIVIDGGSTDRTIDIIKKYESRISYWISEPDGGIADAMNKGIQKSSGRYLLFLHSDDYLVSSSSIRKATEKIQKNFDLHSFPIYWESNGHRLMRRSRGFNPWINFKTGFYHQGIFFHRYLFQRIGLYDTSFLIAMDYEYFLRAYRAAATLIVHGSPPVSVMRDTGVSSKKDWNSISTRFREERQVHSKHASSFLMKIVYKAYWPCYLHYRHLFNQSPKCIGYLF